MKTILENKKYKYFEITVKGNAVKFRINKLTNEMSVNLYDSLKTYGRVKNILELLAIDIILEDINDFLRDNSYAYLRECIYKIRCNKKIIQNMKTTFKNI